MVYQPQRLLCRQTAIPSFFSFAVIGFTVFFGCSSSHIFMPGNAAWAQTMQPSGNQGNQPNDVNGIDKAHDVVSKAVLAPAEWLDSFFGGENDDEENNKTRVRLKLGTFVEEGSGVGFVSKVSIKLSLPSTGNRLNLVIGGDGDDDSSLENTSKDNARERATETDKENVGIGLQYFIYRSDRSNLSTSAGVRLKSGDPVGVFSGRYRYSMPVGTWLVRYIQRLQWLTDEDFVVPTQLEFERPLTEDLQFKTSLGGIWFEQEDGYFYGGSFAVRERLNAVSAISYEWDNQFRTEPNNRLEEVALRARYRRTIWRKWLKFDIVPQLAFPRERDFDPTPGIFMGFEISFGGL